MRIPSKQQRLMALDIVEKNCKSKGAYLKEHVKDYNKFLNKISRMYPAYTKTTNACLSSSKNILIELVKCVHMDNKITNSIQLKWFKSFLNTIVNCVKAGLSVVLGMLNNYIKTSTQDLFNTVVSTGVTLITVSLITSSIVIGTVSAVVILGIGLWMNSAEKQMNDLRIKKGPSWWDKIKDKITGMFGDDEEVPEELLPPEPKTPNITATVINESVALLGAFIFLIMLKAVVINRFNEEIKEKLEILSSLFTPSSVLIGLLTTLLLVGSGGLSAIV